MRLSHINIYATLEENSGKTTTIYTHDRENFFRYEIKYQTNALEFSYNKYLLTTAQHIETSIIKFDTPIQKFSHMHFDQLNQFNEVFENVFKEELIYLSFTAMKGFIMQKLKEGHFQPSDPVIQELMDLYPEAFI